MREILERRSIRRYKNLPVDDALIREILESARLAPSGSNTQPWHFILVKSEKTRRRIAELDHRQEWMTTAPLLIVCVGDVTCRGAEFPVGEDSPEEAVKQVIRDTAIAAEHMVLTAQNLGLGSCLTAWFRQKEIRPILEIPDSKYVCAVLTLGYPDERPPERQRKPLLSMVHCEKW